MDDGWCKLLYDRTGMGCVIFCFEARCMVVSMLLRVAERCLCILDGLWGL